MNIEFESLKLLPQMFALIEKLNNQLEDGHTKRWLNSKELAEYIGYSADAVNKMVQERVFQLDVHYYKPSKKLLFDKLEVDNWILGIENEKTTKDATTILNEILSSIERG